MAKMIEVPKMRHLVSPQVSGGKWEAGLVLTYLRDRPSKVHSSALEAEAALTAQTDSTSAIWKPWRPFEPGGWRAVCGKRITAYISGGLGFHIIFIWGIPLKIILIIHRSNYNLDQSIILELF